MEDPHNYILRFWLLLLVSAVLLCGLYFLPEQIGEWRLKPVDLLSDLRRVESDSTSLLAISPPILMPPAQNSITKSDSLSKDSVVIDSVEKSRKVYLQFLADNGISDSMFIAFEDFSPAHTALKRFYDSLANRLSISRPVRIAVLGDSFIEGDVFTDALRSSLQRSFGGSGVGWMPMTSKVAGFRSSVRQQFHGWNDHEMLTSKQERYPFTGHIYSPEDGAWVSYSMPSQGAQYNRAILYYRAEGESTVRISANDTIWEVTLPPTTPDVLGQYILCDIPQRSIRCTFLSKGEDFISYGMALENNVGISVDNMSIRGNSGLLLQSINGEVSRTFASLRKYDLIILQYGLNVASSNQTNYSSYVKNMGRVIEKIQTISPQSDILLMSVSDRGQRSENGIETMNGVIALHGAQQELARRYGIAFWSTLRAMYALGGISEMTERGWAAKDYTHIGHRGGHELAKKMMEAINFEKKYYDAIRE